MTDVLDLDIHGLAIEVWPEVERIVKMRFPVDTDLTDGWTFIVPHPIAGGAYELTGEIGESDEDTPRPQVTFTMPADRMRDIMRQRFVIALDGVPKISGPIRVANVQSVAGETTVTITLVEPQAIDVAISVVGSSTGRLSVFELPFPSVGTVAGAWQGHPVWTDSGPTVNGDWTNQDPNAFAVPFEGISPLAPLTLWGNGFTALLTGNLLGLFVDGTPPDPTQPIATVPAWARPGTDWTLENCDAFRVRWVSQDETAPYTYHVLRTDENVTGLVNTDGEVTIPGGWPEAPPAGATTVLIDFGVVAWVPDGSTRAMPVGFALRAKIESFSGDATVDPDAGTILCLSGCEQLTLDNGAVSYQEGAAVVVVTTTAAVALSSGTGDPIVGIDGTTFTSHEVAAGTRVVLQYVDGAWYVLADSSVTAGTYTLPDAAKVVVFLAVATTDGTNTSWDVLAPDAAAEADGLVPAGWSSTVHLDMDGADFIALAAPDADPDTVFTVLVPAGDAVGVWQFTPATIEAPWTRVDVSLAYCTAPKWFGAATDAGPWATLAPATADVQALIDAAIAGLIDGAPGALDTLNELAAAINDDASFAAAVTTALAGKVGTDDARLTDARTPLAHEHAGADITSGTVPFARLPVGSGATQVAAGNDSRLSDARTPTDSSVTIAKLAAATIARLGTPLFVASDQASATDASFGNITGLTIPVTNGTTTYFEGVLDITGASAGDFRLSVTGPAGTIRVLLLGKNYASSGAGADFPYISQILAVGDGTPANDMATITGQSQLVLVRGHFIATADGTLQFRHAQRIANATPTTVKAGSNLTYRST